MGNKTIIDELKEAISNSGKKFNSIDKNSIFNFLKEKGISSESWNSVYEKLYSYYNKEEKSIQTTTSSVVDYSDSSHNDVKVRQPRKTIFSEIKKIAG